MDELRRELAQLVRDALFLVAPNRKQKVGQKIEKRKESLEKREVSSPPSQWTLSSLPPPVSTKSAYGRYLTRQEVAIPVLLLLPNEEGEDRLLLENISRAITRSFVPARVALGGEPVADGVKWVLAPLEYLRPILKEATPHLPLVHERRTYIPLEPLAHYRNNRNLKLTLWNTLKTVFQDMHLSS